MFDINTEKWIPVVDEQGKCDVFSQREFFEKAHLIKGIEIQNKPHELGVMIYLCSFAMDVLKPSSIKELKDIFSHGKFDMQKYDDYIQKCKDEGVSFDLFDKTRPYMQEPFTEEMKAIENGDRKKGVYKGINRLSWIEPAGESRTFFHHHLEKEGTMTPAEAMRGLTTVPLYVGRGEGYYGGPSIYKSSIPIYTFIRGKNMFETIVFGMVPRESFGIPYWRSTGLIKYAESRGRKKGITIHEPDFLLMLTFPARNINLGEEKEYIDKIFFYGGAKAQSETWRNPYVSYDKNGNPLLPKKDENTGQLIDMWRNIATLVDRSESAPEVVRYASMLIPDQPINIITYTLAFNHSILESATKNEFFIPEALLSDEMKLDSVRSGIEKTGKIAKAIKKRIEYTLNLKSQCPREMKDSEMHSSGAVSQYVYKYLSDCRHLFYQFLNSETTSYAIWIRETKRSALSTFNIFVTDRCHNIRMLKEGAIQERNLVRELGIKKKRNIVRPERRLKCSRMRTS